MDVDENSGDGAMSDSSNEEEMQKEQLAKVAELEKKIADNVYDYDSHVALISMLRDLADLDKLRTAREAMAKYFPLASDLWMQWLTDEIKIATTQDEKEKIVSLFERAVKDYLSIDVWLEYVQFSIGLQAENDEQGIEKVRNVFERALAAGGLHVAKGSLLWEAYVEYEVAVLSMIQAKNEPIATNKQLKRVANLFRRQLSCPLLDMDETFERFNMWLVDNTGSLDSDVIDRNFVQSTFKKTKEKLSKIEKFEENLISGSREYLEHEKSSEGSPARVQCLYERILAELCLTDYLWVDYSQYVNTTLKDSKAALDIVQRGIRNCPWSFLLYQWCMRLQETIGVPREEVTLTVEQALSSGLKSPTDFRDVWMSYLEFLRRRFDALDITKEDEDKRLEELRAAFSRAVEYINGVDGADPAYVIAKFWARIEAKCCRNMEQARLLWSDILADPENRNVVSIFEYINLETTYGDTKHLRKLYSKFLQQSTDWRDIESISYSWINFERDEGTLETYLDCLSKCEAKTNQYQQQKAKDIEKQQVNTFERINQKREEGRRLKREGLGFAAEKKKTEMKNQGGRGTKRVNEETKQSDGSPEKRKRLEGDTNDIVNQLLSEQKKGHGVSVAHDPSKDNRTIFVSNLDYTTGEESLKTAFEADGNITEVRLVKDFKGRSKGFAYVEFEKVDSAQKALKRDRQLIEGRPMFVSKCDPDKETRGAGFKFSNRMEKNKIFVKGLPFSTTEKDLREMFGKYGVLKDVRLVTYRNGHSKGLAYVDFEDDVSAAQAILKTDGITMGDKLISVAISNPPSRQNPVPAAPVASLGGGAKFGPRGKGRTQISFLPRSLQLSTASSAKGIENLSIVSPQPKTENQ